MKKNKMMRVASALLIAVLLTTSAISGTFAKYVTTNSGSDSARVAKFGVVITANGTAFATSYANDAAIGTTVIGAGTSVNHDATSDGLDLVAPGTTKALVNATIAGTPEVAVNVAYVATLELSGWTWDDDNDASTDEVEYCPIVFTVDGETYGITGIKDYAGSALDHSYATVVALIEAVEAAIEDNSADYAPNTDLSTIGADGYVHVSWAWAFDANNDAADTALGDKAADGSAATIILTVATTVTQID